MPPKFTRTTIPEKETLGEKLAKKRAALGYDLKEAERATRIRARHLEALESGDYTKLPPHVYVVGFLKNYSEFLKLDASKVIKLYLKEKGLVENVKKAVNSNQAKPKNKKREKQKIIITPKRLTIGSILLVTLLIITYIGWHISILAAPPTLAILSPQDNSKTEEQAIVIEGKTDAGGEVFINGIAIAVDPEGSFKEKVGLQEGVNLIKITAKNKLGKEAQSSRTILANLKEALISEEGQKTDLEMKLDIGPDPISIYIEADGRPLSEKNALMLAGSSQIVRAKEKIVISVSDGGSIRATLNGKDLGMLGQKGEKISEKEFNKSSI